MSGIQQGLLASLSSGARVTYNGTYASSSTTGILTITVPGVSFGDAATGRIVAACIVCSTTSTAGVVSSATIGGVSATEAVKTTGSARQVAIFYVTLDSGTSGDVVVTLSQTNAQAAIVACFSIYNASSTTPVTGISQSTATGVSPSRSVTVSLNTNSAAIGVWSAGAVAATGGATWTNLIEQNDTFNADITSAMENNLPSGSRTITCTNTDTSVNRPALLVAAWA